MVVENNEPEWCDSSNYSDLSNHSTILDFDKWMVHYEGFQRFDHQNCLDCGTQPNFFNEQSSNGFIERIRNNLIRKGEKLAIKRSETFQKIIKGDPRKALEIAVSENRLKNLPPQITQHMEKWVSTYADISTIHICNDPKMPNGQIKHFVSLPNYKKVEVHFYGKENF